MNRIELIGFPQAGQYIIFFREKRRKVDEYGNGIPFGVPASHPELQAFEGRLLPPFGKKCGVLNEIGVLVGFFPHVRTDGDVVISEYLALQLGFGGQNGIDAAYHVAYFPADFKQIFGCFVVCFHNHKTKT